MRSSVDSASADKQTSVEAWGDLCLQSGPEMKILISAVTISCQHRLSAAYRDICQSGLGLHGLILSSFFRSRSIQSP